jgi:ABC-2 type transport system permease protein
MTKFLVLLEREMKAYFYSPVAYVVLCFFLALTGFNLYAMVSLLNRGPTEFTLVEAFFNNSIFWFGFLLIIPLITMRLYSEEFKLGTIETLLTAPVHDWQVVLSKFAGALLFYVILWLPTASYFIIFQWVTKEQASSALGAFGGSYLLLLLLGMFYLSIGCLASVLTRNQIIAAIISLVSVVMIFFTGLLGFILPNISQGFRDFVAYFSTVEHMRDFSRGLIDTRPIVYYVSMTIFLQILTFQIFQFRKWKS